MAEMMMVAGLLESCTEKICALPTEYGEGGENG